MRMWGALQVFSDHEEESIHRTALRILDEVGVAVENEAMVDKLATLGGQIDKDTGAGRGDGTCRWSRGTIVGAYRIKPS